MLFCIKSSLSFLWTCHQGRQIEPLHCFAYANLICRLIYLSCTFFHLRYFGRNMGVFYMMYFIIFCLELYFTLSVLYFYSQIVTLRLPLQPKTNRKLLIYPHTLGTLRMREITHCYGWFCSIEFKCNSWYLHFSESNSLSVFFIHNLPNVQLNHVSITPQESSQQLKTKPAYHI